MGQIRYEHVGNGSILFPTAKKKTWIHKITHSYENYPQIFVLLQHHFQLSWIRPASPKTGRGGGGVGWCSKRSQHRNFPMYFWKIFGKWDFCIFLCESLRLFLAWSRSRVTFAPSELWLLVLCLWKFRWWSWNSSRDRAAPGLQI